MTDFATIGIRSDTTGLNRGRDDLRRFRQTGARTEQRINRGSQAMAAGFRALRTTLIPLASAMAATFGARALVSAQEQFQTRMLRIEAIIQATGGVAGRTAQDLERFAQSLARETLQSVDGVLAAQQTLLTFRNVQGEVFDDAIRAAADLSAAMGQDLESTTRQLARALEDPISGMQALTRSGTVFTQQQRDMVREMVETGRTVEAQRFILEELEGQYGGAAQAGSRFAHAQDGFSQSMRNLRIALADSLSAGDRLASAFETLDRWVQSLTEYTDRFASYALAAAVGGAWALRGALMAATAAVWAKVASWQALRAIMIRTGFGALIVGLGEAIYQFGRLVEATGSFGEALEVMGEAAREVLTERIPRIALAALNLLRGRWETMKADFTMALDGMLLQLRSWAARIGGAMMNIPGIGQTIGSGLLLLSRDLSEGLRENAQQMEHTAAQYRQAGMTMLEGAMAPLNALEDLRDRTKETEEETDEAAEAARRFKEALDGLGGAGGGGGGSIGTATTGVDTFRDSLQQTNQVMDRLRSGMSNAFASIVTGAQSAREAIGQLLQQMAQMLANRAFTRLFDSIFGAIGGSSLGGGSWNIGGFNVPSLDFGAAASAPAVPSMSPSPAMASAAGPARGGGDQSQAVQVEVVLRDEMLDARIVGGAGRVVKQHERKVLPKTMQSIQRNPRDIG